MPDATAVQQLVPMSVSEAMAWLLTVAASLFGGAAGMKKWGCPPQPELHNGRLDAIKTMCGALERSATAQGEFMTAVQVAHAQHAEQIRMMAHCMEQRDEILSQISRTLAVMEDRQARLDRLEQMTTTARAQGMVMEDRVMREAREAHGGG